MTIEELKNQLDRIAWLEQTDQEISERPYITSDPSPDLINTQLSQLASTVDDDLLDRLEKEEGYLVWTLRLAIFFEPTRAKQRAQPYIYSPDWRVQYWARKIAHEI